MYRARFDTKYSIYLPLDTVITIRSGQHDTLLNPINLRYLIQIQKFAATYDTLMRCVTFSWGTVDSGIIKGYNLPSNGGTTANFAFAQDGKIYVSQNLLTCILDSSGQQIGRVNNLATNFTLSETGFYTYMNGINSPGKPMKFAHYKPEGNTMVLIDTPVYNTYVTPTADIPRIFAANNKGIVCCCAGQSTQSVFVNYRYQNREFHARLYLGNQLWITDLHLTEENKLFILYETGQIDVADLSERIEMFEQN